ncbi:MAG: aldose epimerase family protein [Bacteroidia bacterium]|nr:aldose epimerase family protein [Bacteroidia bacterium]
MKPVKSIIVALCALAAVGCAKTTSVDNQFFTLKNDAGMEVTVTNFGGRITAILVPDRDGVMRDVVLGFDKVEDYYPENNESDFGASIGRYANRIQNGRFTLDGVEYDLPKNNFGHCLHGGPTGWQYQPYKVVEADETHIKLEMDSPDGDNNFPGNVTAFVTYTLTQDNKIDIAYEATTDAPTIINMTNHSYFNLSGDPANHSVCEDKLFVNASYYTPVDNTYMTTGEILPVAGTPMDFTSPKKVGAEIGNFDFEQLKNGNGYDHNWVLDTAGDINLVAARFACPQTGIKLEVFTDEPGIQVYSGNFLDGTVTGKGGVVYNQHAGLCLETQHYPDSPNKADWPSVVLRPGETYTSHCIFAFSVCSGDDHCAQENQ